MDLVREQAECAKMWMERRAINKTQACETLVDSKVVAKEKTHVTVLLHTSVVFPLFICSPMFSHPVLGQVRPNLRNARASSDLFAHLSALIGKKKRKIWPTAWEPRVIYGTVRCPPPSSHKVSSRLNQWSEGIDSRFPCDVAAFYPESNVLRDGNQVDNKAITSQLFQNRWYRVISVIYFVNSSELVTH